MSNFFQIYRLHELLNNTLEMHHAKNIQTISILCIRKLAEEANCSASYLNRIEHGQRRLDSMANIILLASILDFPVSELLQLTSLSDAEMLSPIRTAFPSIQTSHQETVITKFARLITSGALSEEQMDQLIFNATAFKEYCQKCNQHK